MYPKTPPICGSLIRLDYKIKNLEYHLDVIEQDHLLLQKGWRIHFAIDLHEVFNFAYPIYEILTQKKLNQEKKERVVQQQASRIFLFSGLKEITSNILLPSFAIELTALMTRLVTGALEKRFIIGNIQEYWKDTLSKDERDAISKATEQIKKSDARTVSQQILKKALNVIRERFGCLLFILYASAGEGPKRMTSLLNKENPNLKSLSQVFPELIEVISEIDENTVRESQWFKMFTIIRDKWVSDFRDAHAIESINRLNERLIQRDPPEIILLVSNADSMRWVLNWDMYKEVRKKLQEELGDEEQKGIHMSNLKPGVIHTNTEIGEIRILRTLDTFLQYLICEGQNNDLIKRRSETINGVKNQRAKFVKYHQLSSPWIKALKDRCEHYNIMNDEYKYNNQHCFDPTDVDEYRKIEAVISKYQTVFEDSINAELYSKSVYFVEASSSLDQGRINEHLFIVLKELNSFISMHSDDFSQWFKDRATLLLQNLDEIRSEFHRVILRSSIQTVPWQIKHKIDIITRIRHRLEFRDENIDKVLSELSSISQDEANVEDLVTVLSRLLELCERKELSLEFELLYATMMYAYEKYDLCIKTIDNILEMPGDRVSYSAKYLKAVALLESGKRSKSADFMKLALVITDELISEKKDDPRGYYLRGLAIGMSLEEKCLVDYSRDDILRFFEKALKLCSNEELKKAIFNNYAYAIFVYFGNDKSKIDDAVRMLNNLREISPNINKWPTGYVDTDSCIKLLQARITVDIQEKQKLLDEARKQLIQAYKESETFGAPKDFLQVLNAHLELIEKEQKQSNSSIPNP